jgi:sugar lactone lactonase YvrE
MAALALALPAIAVLVGSQSAGAAGPVTPPVGTLFVADTLDSQVWEVTPTAGSNDNTIGSGFDEPTGLAIDGQGNVYIADTNNNRVEEFDYSTQVQTTIGSGLSQPDAVAVDAAGDVYIADTGNNRVVEVAVGSDTQTTVLSGLSSPDGLAVDAAGDLFVANYGGNDVIELPSGGSQTTVGTGLNGPGALAIDAHGDLYVTEFNSNKVIEIPSGGGSQLSIGSGLNGPDGVAVDAAGNVFIADFGDGEFGTANVFEVLAAGEVSILVAHDRDPAGVVVYAPPPVFTADTPPATTGTSASYSYTYAAAAVVSGEPAASFAVASGSLPPGLNLNAKTGELYGFASTAGTYNFVIEAENAADGTLGPPTTITVSQGLTPGTLLVADASSDIHEVPPNGGAQTQLDAGVPGSLSTAVDPAGDVFVDDPTNNRVVEVAPDGSTTTVGSGLSDPTALAVDPEGDVFIVNSGTEDVIKVSADGTQTMIGTGLGPSDVAADDEGDVFVAYPRSDDVVKVAANGTQSTVVTGMIVRSLAVDAAGDLYAGTGSEVVKITPSGTQTTVVTGIGSPESVALDAAGDVFVADDENHDVVEAPAGGGPQTTVTVTGLNGPHGVSVFDPAPLFTADLATASAARGVHYSFAYTSLVDPGEPDVAYKLVSGGLPPGLVLAAATGQLSGKPTTTGTYNFVVEVGNVAHGSLSVTNTITVGLGVPEPGAVFVIDGGQVAEIPPGGGTFGFIGQGIADATDVAVDSAGDVFITDAGNQDVVEEPGNGSPQVTIATGLDFPNGIAVDAAGDVYIANTVANEVLEIPAGGGSDTTVGSGLSSPVGLAVDAAGDVFIADVGNSRVVEVPAGGGTQTTVGTGLDGPNGVTVDAAGDVYIADTADNRVVEVPAGGGTQTTLGTGLVDPTGVALDAEGDVFISDYGNNRLVEEPVGGAQLVGPTVTSPSGVAAFAPPPVFLDDSPTPTATQGKGYSYFFQASVQAGKPLPSYALASGELPPGLKLNTATGDLSGIPATPGTYNFVVETENAANGTIGVQNTIRVATGSAPLTPGTVFVAEASGNTVLEIPAGGGASTHIGSGLAEPGDVTVDNAGDVFIADTGNNRVVEVPAGGAPQETLASSLDDPQAVAVDPEGDVFIAESSANTVFEMPANGDPSIVVGSNLNDPVALAVDAQGDVYIADYGSDDVVEVPAHGGPQKVVSSGSTGPYSLAVDAAGDVFVGYSGVGDGDGEVLEIPAAGGAPTTIGSGVSLPAGVGLDAEGNVYISDLSNARVVEVAPDGTQTKFATGLSGPSGLSVFAPPPTFTADDLPTKTAVQGTPFGYTFTASVSAGEPAATFSVSAGTVPPGLVLHRATGVLSGTPTFPGVYFFTVSTENAAQETVGRSLALRINPDATDTPAIGTIYVTDLGDRVEAIAPDGTAQAQVGTALDYPAAVAVDAYGNLYVADEGNNRIVEIPAGGGTQRPVYAGSDPVGVSIDGNGDLFIADTNDNKVVEIPVNSDTQEPLGSGWNGPTGVAADAAGDVFVANYGGNDIVEIPAGGGAETTITSALGESLNGPSAVAVDGTGDLFVADTDNNRVLEIEPNGGGVTTVGTGLHLPTGVAVDDAGDVLIADESGLIEVPTGGRPQFLVGHGLQAPVGVAVYNPAPTFTTDTPPTGTLGQAYTYTYTASTPPGEGAPFFIVQGGSLPPGLSLNPLTGILSGTPTTPGTYTFRVQLANAGVAAAGPLTTISVSFPLIAQGAVLITDSGRVLSLAAGGGSLHLEDAALSLASEVAVDAKGDMFFDGASGSHIVELPDVAGSSPILLGSGLQSPSGIAVDANGDVFIADTLNNRVVELPAGGGAQVTVLSGLKDPESVAVDVRGDLFIADTGDNRVLELAAGTTTPTTVGTGLLGPAGVAVDAAGNVYIADFYNHRVVKVAAGTRTQSTVGTGLAGPWSVTVDAAGDVYVADISGAQVVEVTPSGTQTTVGSGLTRPYGVASYSPAPTFTSDTPPAVTTLGASYSYDYTAARPAGEPASSFVLASGTLPTGLTLNATTGQLSGKTTVAAKFSFAIEVENAADGTLSPTMTIEVEAAAAFTADTPPNRAKTRSAYGYFFRASGYPPAVFAVSAGSLPPGLGLDRTTGELAGKPTKVGTYKFEVEASNGVGRVVTSPEITIVVTSGPTPRVVKQGLITRVGTLTRTTSPATDLQQRARKEPR